MDTMALISRHEAAMLKYIKVKRYAFTTRVNRRTNEPEMNIDCDNCNIFISHCAMFFVSYLYKANKYRDTHVWYMNNRHSSYELW